MRQAAEPAGGRTGGRRIIERPRLIKLLEGASARTILLIAPAGYGKTTLARQWAERQTGVHWYTARTGSADVAQLAVDLAAALDEHPPKLKDYVTQLVRARSSPTQQVSEIVEGFAGAAGDAGAVSLFIDDYHVIAEDEVAEWFVHELQSRLGFRLFIASRTRPNWATARLQIYGETVEFGADELALTDEEAAEVLGRGPDEATRVLQTTRGWPVVVSLAAQTDAELSSGAGAATTLFRYFAEELFRASTQEQQERLLILALLPNLSRSLVQSALDIDAQGVIDAAITSGFATKSGESAELHPLVRDYLLMRLAKEPSAEDRVRLAFQLSLDRGLWHHAFELITRFQLPDLLPELIERAFMPLVSSGRIATAEQMAAYGHTCGYVSPLIDLIDAESAFRHGFFARSEVIAARAARDLGETHALTSRAWWIAGQGAQLCFESARAFQHFASARETARSDEDLRDALWGLALTSTQTEAETANETFEPLIARRHRSPIDTVRATAAQILLEQLSGSGDPIRLDGPLHALEAITDPHVRTSFLNASVYYLILRGEYDEAHVLAERMRATVAAYQLTWAQPHADWALAAIALGRRQIAESNTWLRRVERAADEGRFGPLLLNAGCLRARQALALRQPHEAWSSLMVDETLAANRAMKGEFYATKALVLAVLDQPAESRAWAEKARATTGCVEARVYAHYAASILALADGAPPARIAQLVGDAARTHVWDAFVSAMRAQPELLATLARAGPLQPEMTAALRRAYDFDLSKHAGLEIGRRPRNSAALGGLSPREQEVLELIAQGLSNQDIARTLFISKSTVKVHVRHILEKTGARSRTEAAASRDD